MRLVYEIGKWQWNSNSNTLRVQSLLLLLDFPKKKQTIFVYVIGN